MIKYNEAINKILVALRSRRVALDVHISKHTNVYKFYKLKFEGKHRKSKTPQRTRKSVINDRPEKKTVQGSAEIDIIDTAEYQEKIEMVYSYLKQGMRSQEIFAMLTVDYPDVTESNFAKILTLAFDFAKSAMHKDRDYVFQLHMARYEDIYQKLMEEVEGFVRPTTSQEWAKWRTVVTKYQQAVSALNRKEDLLGLHDKRVVLEFNDNQAIVVNNSSDQYEGVVGYNFNNISLQEQIELLAMIKEARTVPIEGIQRIVIRQTIVEINPNTGERHFVQNARHIDNVIDVKFEEMPPDVIGKMQNIPEPVEEKEEIKEIVRSFVPEQEKKTIDDLITSTRKSVMERFKQQLKGSK